MKRWPQRRLGDLTDVLSGFAFDSEGFGDSGEMPVVRIRDVVPGRSSTFYRGAFDPRFIVGNGDILIGMDGEFNRARWCGGRALLNQRVSRIAPSCPDIDDGYLFYFLPAALKAIEQVTPFVTVKHLSVKQIRDIVVPLPPLPEQRRIAAILDKADAMRAKRRAALAQLDTLTQSIFIDMFGDPSANPKGWPWVSLGTLLRGVTNGMTRRRTETDPGERIVLRLRDIRDGWIDFSDVNRITLTADERNKYEALAGDLLFIRVNGNPDYVGRCALFEGYSENVYFNDHVMRVRVDQSSINGVYLTYLLNGLHGKSEIAKHRKTSAGQHTINQDGLNRIRLPLPSLPVQVDFVSRIAAVEKLRTSQATSAGDFDGLFASLQHRAFEGEL